MTDMVQKSRRQQAKEEAHAAKVRQHENEAVANMLASDPNDQSERARYIREVGNDIIGGRAETN